MATPKFSEIVLILPDFPFCLKDLTWLQQEFLLKKVIFPFFGEDWLDRCVRYEARMVSVSDLGGGECGQRTSI